MMTSPNRYPATMAEIADTQAHAQRCAAEGKPIQECPYLHADTDRERLLRRVWFTAYRQHQTETQTADVLELATTPEPQIDADHGTTPQTQPTALDTIMERLRSTDRHATPATPPPTQAPHTIEWER